MLKAASSASSVPWLLAVAWRHQQRMRSRHRLGDEGSAVSQEACPEPCFPSLARSSAITSNQRRKNGAAPKAGGDCGAVPEGNNSKEHASETTALLISVERCNHF